MAKLSTFIDMLVVFEKETGVLIKSLELDTKNDKKIEEEFDFEDLEGIKCFGNIKSSYTVQTDDIADSIKHHDGNLREEIKKIGIKDDFLLTMNKSETTQGLGLFRVNTDFDINFYMEKSLLEKYYNNYIESLNKSEK